MPKKSKNTRPSAKDLNFEHFPLVDRLHTDVLEERYGPIHSEVLIHNDTIRKAHLVDGKGISRTFAITFLSPKNWDKEIECINGRIRRGEPIGKEFRRKGYAIRKNMLAVYTINLPEWLKGAFKTKEKMAKARLSEFYAKKRGKEPVIYGVVVEIYAPDFRKPAINDTDKLQASATTQSLEKQGFTKEEIWQRIGNDNDYNDVLEKFLNAKINSAKAIRDFKQRIAKTITE